ncbi:AfaD family invasin [Escherichia coli]|uniref:AfaD family invasin n=1 Tax=Escherichia coli TaxID=562 RepID=UPI00050AB3EB|nr:AfaD family invasin [Escherichia coli]MBN6582052.1 hypothetical protein [Escherichia coli]MDD8354205.1 hypothetical protein [Escherichia coli]HAG7432591.1 hypothetical protein [Escherichia coli]HAW7443484.1 hypothetical protein [Escherichia coli]HAW7443846.1 hypothetical protein [Escherichia coli]
MIRKIIFSLCLIIGFTLTVNAKGMSLESRVTSGGELFDGDIIATGIVYCEGGDVSWLGLMNIHHGDNTLGNVYTLQGRNMLTNELVVRIEGDGWHPSNIGKKGIYKTKVSGSEQFHVVVNGHQNVNPDVYTIKANSACSSSHQE